MRQERRAPVRRWMRRMPLVTGALLAALVVIPIWLRSRTDELRGRVTDVALPTRNALLEVQIAFASELAAIRGYELTGDTLFLEDFRVGLEKDRRATERLLRLAPALGPDAAAAVTELHGRKQAWLEQPREALAGRRTRQQLIRSLEEGERKVDSVLVAADQANVAVINAEMEMRRSVARDERMASTLVSLLALAALAVAIVVGWLVRKLDSLAREAQEAVHYRDQMLRVVSHDLKNPLHTIGMVAESLSEPNVPEQNRVRQLQIVRRTVDRMDRLIHDLLDAARVQSGHALAVSPAQFDTRAFCADLADQFGVEAQRRNIDLTCDVESAPDTLVADRDRLEQVFSNIVGNAIKFTGEGGRIIVKGEREGGGVRFTIADTGPGIPPDNIPRLFDPFWQGRERANLGSGLGLSIARGIIEAHGGNISVASVPGEGTTFSFTIPQPA